MGNLTPGKIETLEPTDPKFVTVDWVGEFTPQTKFRKNTSTVALWANGRNYVCIIFIIFFIFFLGPTSNPWADFDAKWIKRRKIIQNSIFGVRIFNFNILSLFAPQNVNN